MEINELSLILDHALEKYERGNPPHQPQHEHRPLYYHGERHLPGEVPDGVHSAKICACEFPSIKGGKPFNVRKGSFRKMLSEIGQPKPRKKRTAK